SATEIVSNIEEGKWTAGEVLEAYISAAVRAQEATNCITEVLFGPARSRAKALDASYASTGRIVGPFHGVPFSIKVLDYEGFDSTIGFSQWIGKPANKHAALVSQIIAAGGIPFVKTNVPQTMFSFECNNPLWGRTLNPRGTAFTCGGSSGGEAAILAADGSALGIGSDIGGSLRMPAAYCGIYSLKPTAGRVSTEGGVNPSPGFEGIKTSFGPMGRSVADLDVFCRAIFGLEDKYRHAVPLPYRKFDVKSALKFGYYTSDGFIKASPANKRAVLQSVEALRRQGHECVEVVPPSGHEALEIYLAMTSADDFHRMTSQIGSDPVDPALYLTVYGSRMPGFILSIATWALRNIIHDPQFATVMDAGGSKSYEKYSKWVERRNEFEKTFFDAVWERHGLDGIIAPVQSMPQLPHGAVTTLSPLCVATVLYNLLDYPAGVVPVTRVDAGQDWLTEEWAVRGGQGSGSVWIEDVLYRKGKKSVYNAKDMDGMPVGVQVVGKRWEDEKVLHMMQVLDEALGKRGFGPGSSL
ncbi:amidase signature enzyme, partial [Cylindrobasidium torrendii FP15055 ss-10]